MGIRVAVVSVDKDLIDLLGTLEGFDLVGVIDRDAGADTAGLPWLGTDEDWPEIRQRYPDLSVALAVDPCLLKRRLAMWYGIEALTGVRAHDCYVSESAKIGCGVLLQRGVKVFTGASVGTACKINVNATLHHDCRVGEFCTIAPGAQLLGRVEVGPEAYIGAGAVLLPGTRVGAAATVGAGAVVTADVLEGTVVAGVPARLLRTGVR